MDADAERRIGELKGQQKQGYCGCINGGGASLTGYCSSDGMFACGCAHLDALKCKNEGASSQGVCHSVKGGFNQRLCKWHRSNAAYQADRELDSIYKSQCQTLSDEHGMYIVDKTWKFDTSKKNHLRLADIIITMENG